MCVMYPALHDVDQKVTERKLLIRYRSGCFAEAQDACVARVSSIATLSIHFESIRRAGALLVALSLHGHHTSFEGRVRNAVTCIAACEVMFECAWLAKAM